MDWLKRLLCRHESVEVRTFIENDGAPLVRRTITCTRCRSHKGFVPDRMPDHIILNLLERAKSLPVGSRVEV